MKNYNEKIQNFLSWMKQGENGDERFLIPSRDLFELYRMENPEVSELSIEEGKYIDVLQKVTLINKKGLTPEVRKLALANEFGYVDRPKIAEDTVDEYVIFDTTGLDMTVPTNHNQEDLTNDAIKDMPNKGDTNGGTR